jgi:hypothetical protein
MRQRGAPFVTTFPPPLRRALRDEAVAQANSGRVNMNVILVELAYLKVKARMSRAECIEVEAFIAKAR